MPSIGTRFFGVAEYAEEDVITFPGGIPPFDSTRFVLMSDERRRPLLFLQSVDDEALCFIMVPVRAADPDYRFAVEAADAVQLGCEHDRPLSLDDFLTLAILTVPDDGPVTANLLAPVLINSKARLGVQIVRADCSYTHAHPLEAAMHAGGPEC